MYACTYITVEKTTKCETLKIVNIRKRHEALCLSWKIYID